MNFLKEKTGLILTFIPAILLIIVFILSNIGIFPDKLTSQIFQISSIIIALLIPFISTTNTERKELRKLKKANQEIFNILTELSKICIERGDERVDERDVKIFHLSRKFKSYFEYLVNLNITFTEQYRKGLATTILIGDGLKIFLNVDEGNGRVWYANVSMSRYKTEIRDKNILKSDSYVILEKMKKEQNLKWNKEIEQYFLNSD